MRLLLPLVIGFAAFAHADPWPKAKCEEYRIGLSTFGLNFEAFEANPTVIPPDIKSVLCAQKSDEDCRAYVRETQMVVGFGKGIICENLNEEQCHALMQAHFSEHCPPAQGDANLGNK